MGFLVIHVVIIKGKGTQHFYVELRTLWSCHYHAKTEFNLKKHRKKHRHICQLMRLIWRQHMDKELAF